MAIELKQSLKMSQSLVITPQLQQAIKLLQLSRLELVEMVREELMENPVLEEAPGEEEEDVGRELNAEIETPDVIDKSHEAAAEVGNKDGDLTEPKEFDWENYVNTYNSSKEEARSFNPDELPNYENTLTQPESLSDHLEWQLRLASLTEEEEEVGMAIIGAIDDNGYLSISTEEIAAKNGFDPFRVNDMLEYIQEFDPAGVGARNLKECLMLQTRHCGAEKALVRSIIENHLSLLERKDYLAIVRKLRVPVEQVIAAANVIGEMEPKPGRAYGGTAPQYITPDVYVTKVGMDYVVVLNDEGLPRLRVSQLYRNMIMKSHDQTASDDTTKGYIQDKLKKALWLIKSYHQRQRTVYKVARCIVEHQRDFLDKGVNQLKPMVLRDVAEKVGVHESTVSRATSNKYMHTPQGLFEMKYFFNNKVATTEGDGMAAEAVKELIRKMVQAENVKNPLSDQEIVEQLKSSNIHIARRTVAKYREIMHILPSSRRKQMY